MSLSRKSLAALTIVTLMAALLATVVLGWTNVEVGDTPLKTVELSDLTHAVPVEAHMVYIPGIAEEIAAAGGSATVTGKPALADDRRIHARQNVRVTVTSTIEPLPLREDADAEVRIDVKTDVASPLRSVLGQETVRLESESFRIRPSEPRVLDLDKDSTVARYVITPTGVGNKLLRVFARHTNGQEFEDVLKVQVVRVEPAFLGIDNTTWKRLQAGCAAIGLPGLAILCITRWLDARKRRAEQKKETDDRAPKIIMPK
ncbi:hypothetical protein P9281_34610 [Caballeronia sp. LP003]|uniref:hypothetical protein n=1 Tax=Caballeronia sp. LP003 TaxID=3038551 RepID=UPI00285A5E76|nr:hypothetical protein [Caballeronia sp. LP003]MDR5791681.1 hypothetical protein [Caballeronia sp. LP003]